MNEVIVIIYETKICRTTKKAIQININQMQEHSKVYDGLLSDNLGIVLENKNGFENGVKH